MFERIANYLIKRAARTPYYDLPGYMKRNWLVPYADKEQGLGHGSGPVPFLRRPLAWVLQRFDIAIRVHEILCSDDGRDPHDHPWPYLTVILKGGYYEHRPIFNGDGLVVGETRKWYGPGSVLFRRAASWHWLELPPANSATTLFITGKYRRGWGFLVNGSTNPRKIGHKEYLGANAC